MASPLWSVSANPLWGYQPISADTVYGMLQGPLYHPCSLLLPCANIFMGFHPFFLKMIYFVKVYKNSAPVCG